MSDTIWPTPGSQMPGASPDNKKVKNLLTGSRHSFYLTQAVEAERIQPGTITDSESCHSSQAAGEVCSAASSLDGEQLPLLSGTPTASESSVPGAVTWPTIRAGNPGSRRPGTGGKVLAEEVKKASPSTAMYGTSTPSPDRATSSRVASRASRSVRPGNGLVRMTRATCGHTPFAYWSSQERRWDSSRTCLDFSAQDTSEPYSETWPKRGSMRSGACWEQTMSVPRIDASGSGFWPTATAQVRECDPDQREKRREQQGGTLHSTYLQDAVKYQVEQRTYPTPTADDASNVTRDSGDFQSLTRAARGGATRQTWATVTSRGHKDTGTMENVPENALLGRQVMNRTYQTPSQADAEGGHRCRGGSRADELLLAGQAQAADQVQTGSLNPNWVAYLMGWPVGWEDASLESQWECPSASTDCEHLATVRCLNAWLQRSRTWLDRLE